MPQASANNFIHSDTVIFGTDSGIHYRDSITGKLTFLVSGAANALRFLATDAAGVPIWTASPSFTLADNQVTFQKIQNISSQTILGRNTAGVGNVEALTDVQLRTILGLGTAALVATGNQAGQIPLLEAGNVLNASVIPALRSHEFVQVANAAARLALTTTQVQPGDEAFETDTSRTFKLIAANPSLSGSWVLVSDAVLDAADIQTGVFSPSRLGTGTANSGTVLFGDGTYKASPSGKDPLTVLTATGGTLAGNNRYFANHTVRSSNALPATAAQGDVIEITDILGNGFRITQSSSQRIFLPTGEGTTLGVSGFIENPLGDGITTALSRYCRVRLECIIANTTWLLTAQSAIVTYV